MKFTASFVIFPKPALAEQLKETELADAPFATEPVLWNCDWIDRSPWTKSEVEEGVKIAFLHQLRVAYLSDQQARKLGIDSAPTTSQFDVFWQMHVFLGPDAILEEVIEAAAKNGQLSTQNDFLRTKIEFVQHRNSA
ncbi:MAG: hypothetical protein QM755_03320 [Luteolibacter sp.]